MINYKQNLWNKFCNRHKIFEEGVPLFTVADNKVKLVETGKDRRLVLVRSSEMESFVIQEVNKVLKDDDGSGKYEGLIYMMFKKDSGQVVPLYIGKSEKFGKTSGRISENIKNIVSNKGKFCRWGHQYAYHIGDLSAVVCKGHSPDKQSPKYKRWADKLFTEYPSSEPCLRTPIYFWISAWEKDSIGIWEEFGSTSLTFLEYLLIGVASNLFPSDLLNAEGVNRP